MVYQDRHETESLQLFAHPENSERFYNFCYYFWGQHCCL